MTREHLALSTPTIYLALLMSSCGGGSGMGLELAPIVELEPLPAANALEYELIPGGHLVAYLATNKFDSIYSESLNSGVPGDLISAGYSVISFDLPCHGPELVEEFPLSCWRRRLEAGEHDLFTKFCAGFSAALDALNVTAISIVGQSRGGYLGATCAAYDSRVKNLLLLAPVTELQVLWEFDGYTVDPSIFGLNRYAPYMMGINILIRINSDDTRVGTNSAIDFAAHLGAELDVLEQEGHAVINDGRVTTWLMEKTSSGSN